MKTFGKKAAAALLALVILAASLMASGCSTPKVAMTVDGTDYSTGEYLAFLYNSFYSQYVGRSLYYYDMYTSGYDVWGQKYTYNDKEYGLADLIKEQAKDSVKRAVAVDRLMKEQGVTFTEEDEKEIAAAVESYPKDGLDYGFSKESFSRMVRELYAANTLFNGLYGKDGKQAVSEEELRKYFDENYLSYKIVSYTLQDSEGKDLSAEDIATLTEKLEKYKALFDASGDFDAVIAQKKADDTPATTTTTTAADTTTSTEAATEPTEAATEPTEAAAEPTEATTEPTGTVTEPTEDGDGDHDHDHETETATDPNRNDLVISQSEEEGLIAELKTIEFGQVKIFEYKTAEGTPMKALALRLDPEADRGKDADGNEVNYYEDQKENVLHYMKDEDFEKLLNDKIATFQVDVSDRAVNAGDPQEFKKLLGLG